MKDGSMEIGSKSRGKYVDFEDEIVFVKSGAHRGRIGYSDTIEGSKLKVSFGDHLSVPHIYVIPGSSLRACTMNDIVQRYGELIEITSRNNWMGLEKRKISDQRLIEALHELILVQDQLMARYRVARYDTETTGKKLFLSHNSKDKHIVRTVHADMRHLGHSPWLDEYDVLVGESIVKAVQTGIRNSDFVILFWSENAKRSRWVETEWQTKFWEEISLNDSKILVARLDDAELPDFLKPRRCADFRVDYQEALEELSRTIEHDKLVRSENPLELR